MRHSVGWPETPSQRRVRRAPRRRHDALADAAERLRAILEVSRALTLLDDEDELLQLIVASACQCLGYKASVIAVSDADGIFRYRATAGVSPVQDRHLRTLSMTSEAFEILRAAATPFGSVLYVPPRHPVRAHPALSASFLSTEASYTDAEWQAGALLFIPLLGLDGEVMGFLNPDDPIDGGLPMRGQIAVLEAFGHQAVTALQIVRGRAAERDRARAAEAQRRQLEGFLRASASVRGSLQLDEVLQQIADAMTGAGGFEGAVIYLRDSSTDLLHARAAVGLPADEEARLRAAPVPLTLFQHIMQPQMRVSRSYLFDHRYHTVPQELDDAMSIPELSPDWQEGQWHPEDSLTVPLEDRAGYLIGVISVDQPYDRRFPTVASIQALELFADQCVVAVEQAYLYEKMHLLAMTDMLTGLPNRTAFHDRLQQALATSRREKGSLALLLMDLDRFKEVNDTLGHHYGDVVLQQVGLRVKSLLRASDTVARLGGDEFAVLLPGDDDAGATVAAEKIQAALGDPFMVEEQSLHVGCSLGIALFPTHGTDAETLLRRADVAMYMAKRGEGRYALYAPEHDAYTPQRFALIGELRQAIANGALVLHYQPKIELASGQVQRVEALVRWPHPVHGLIPPDQFIPLAEQTGLIDALTHWVLGEAVRQYSAWRDAGLCLGVNVNLSMLNLSDAHLEETIVRLLDTHDMSADDLRLEITESAITADMVRASAVLARLAARGIRIAIDDFGIGYSSLSYLKRLPVDEIKIDRSFVRHLRQDETDATIVASTVSLGHSLGLRVVAEGVEDQETCDILADLGCDAAQGYYVTCPLAAAELAAWLRQGRWPAPDAS